MNFQGGDRRAAVRGPGPLTYSVGGTCEGEGARLPDVFDGSRAYDRTVLATYSHDPVKRPLGHREGHRTDANPCAATVPPSLRGCRT